MIQRRRRLRLLLKAAVTLGVADELGAQDFKSDRAIEMRIGRLVDDAHAAFGELCLDTIVAERPPYHSALMIRPWLTRVKRPTNSM